MSSAPPPPSDTPAHPDDEHEKPDVSTVPNGAVAVFQAPRAVRPNGAVAKSNGQPNGRPDIESPFLDLFGAPARRPPQATVEGEVVAESPAHAVPPGGEVALRWPAGAVPPAPAEAPVSPPPAPPEQPAVVAAPPATAPQHRRTKGKPPPQPRPPK